MKTFFLYSSLLCLSFNTLAWSERGNGGNSIICDDPSQNKFYDAYEAEYRYGLKPVFPTPERMCFNQATCFNQSMAIARILINRIPDYGENLLKEFMKSNLSHFKDEVNFLEDIVLLPINDIGITFIPKNCKLHQTVIQKQPRFPGDKTYIISYDQWKKLTPNHQAVGIIHELLYSYARSIKRKLNDSEGIRYLNGLIISGEISKLDRARYYELYSLIFSENTYHNE